MFASRDNRESFLDAVFFLITPFFAAFASFFCASCISFIAVFPDATTVFAVLTASLYAFLTTKLLAARFWSWRSAFLALALFGII